MDFLENVPQLKILIESYRNYRSSLFVAGMLEAGFGPEDVIITRRKADMEGVPHEIENIRQKYPNQGRPYIEIETGKYGIYDSMPEGIFFVGQVGKKLDKDASIERMRYDRETERHVRHFMSIFEVEADFFLTRMQLGEMSFDKALSTDSLKNFYAKHWDIISIMRRSELMRFMRVLPNIPDIKSNLRSVSESISYIMGINVKVVRGIQQKKTEHVRQIKETIRLGDNLILNSSKRFQKTETLFVIVSDIDTVKCREFIKNHIGDRILIFLCEIMLEVKTEFKIVVRPNAESRKFTLRTSDNKASYLGKNTYI